MSEKRGIIIHFMDGSKKLLEFPQQVADSDASAAAKLKQALEARHRADHRGGVEGRAGAGRGLRRPRSRGGRPRRADFADSAHLAAHGAGLRPRRRGRPCKTGDKDAHRPIRQATG